MENRKSGCAGGFEGGGPPEEVVNHGGGRAVERGEFLFDVAAFTVGFEDSGGDVDGEADGGELEFDGDFPELLDGTGAADAGCSASAVASGRAPLISGPSAIRSKS